MTTDLLILGTMDGALSALDGRDGSSLWRRELGAVLTGPSALVRVADVVIAAALDGYVCALALADGALRWEMTIPDVPQGSGPNNPGHRVVTNGEVVVIEHGPTYTGHDPADGHIVWSSGASREAQGWWAARRRGRIRLRPANGISSSLPRLRLQSRSGRGYFRTLSRRRSPPGMERRNGFFMTSPLVAPPGMAPHHWWRRMECFIPMARDCTPSTRLSTIRCGGPGSICRRFP